MATKKTKAGRKGPTASERDRTKRSRENNNTISPEALAHTHGGVRPRRNSTGGYLSPAEAAANFIRDPQSFMKAHQITINEHKDAPPEGQIHRYGFEHSGPRTGRYAIKPAEERHDPNATFDAMTIPSLHLNFGAPQPNNPPGVQHNVPGVRLTSAGPPLAFPGTLNGCSVVSRRDRTNSNPKAIVVGHVNAATVLPGGGHNGNRLGHVLQDAHLTANQNSAPVQRSYSAQGWPPGRAPSSQHVYPSDKNATVVFARDGKGGWTGIAQEYLRFEDPKGIKTKTITEKPSIKDKFDTWRDARRVRRKTQ